MKKSMILNSKKIIIFVLLVIGIILLSPIINNSVYARTGKLPAQINNGLFKGVMDDVSEALDLSEKKYTNTREYEENEKYLESKGYSVSPAVTEGDEFWTSKGSLLQLFDDNYQEAEKIVSNGGYDQINGTKIKPYIFQDLIKYKDVYCSNKEVLLFQEADDLGTIFGLPDGSELAKRLNNFVNQRNAKLGNLSSREAAFALDSAAASKFTFLDDYGVEYHGSMPSHIYNLTANEMFKTFGYLYQGTTTSSPTFPYAIKEIDLEGIVSENLIIKVVGDNQAISGNFMNKASIMIWATSENLRKIFDKGVEKAISSELGILYNPEATINTHWHTLPDSVADRKNLIRTRSFYDLAVQEKTLSPQSAYALATQSKNKNPGGYPGDAQEVLWTILEDQYKDILAGSGDFVQYVVKSASAIETKTFAEAFEAYYKRLIEWKNKNEGSFAAKFLNTERNIIFNSKSETYDEGAWLVGPYKLDYLLSTVKYNNTETYFAGMTNMTISGEYNDKANSIKEIKKWSYFVPIQTSETTLTAEQIAEGKVTSLKHGVPEPNQEFYIEIPYDENLIRISELKAKFKAIDHDVNANYHVGMGEYIDFKLDVAVEKTESMAHAYRDVAKPIIEFDIISGTDVGILKLTFPYPVYLTSNTNGSTTPNFKIAGINSGEDPYSGWSRAVDSETDELLDNVIYRKIKYDERNQSNFNPDYFYYKYDAIKAKGTDINGGDISTISFSEAYKGKIELTTKQKNLFIKLKLNRSVSDDEVTMTPTINVTRKGSSKTYYQDESYDFNRGKSSKTYTFVSEGGQTATLRIPALPPPPEPPVTPSPGGELKLPLDLVKHNNLSTVVINTTEVGKTNKSSRYAIDIGGGYISDLSDDYTYVLHKRPDVLVVPKARLLKTVSQPQMSVKGGLIVLDTEAVLKENLGLSNTPGFLLPIGGKVWEDNPYGDKLSTYNFILNSGKMDTEDSLFRDITVRVNRLIIRNSDKAIIEKQAARVFEKGEYSNPIGRDAIKTNKKGEWGKYYLRDLGFTRLELAKGYSTRTHVVKFEIEFEYDGIEYMPVPALASISYNPERFSFKTAKRAANDSVAVENVEVRDTFNRSMGEINGFSTMDADRDSVGQAIGVNGVTDGNYNLIYSGYLNTDSNRTVSTLETKRNIRASTLNTGILYPIGDVYNIDMKQAMSENSATSETNGSFDLVVIMNREKARNYRNKVGITVTDALDDKSVVVFHESNTHMENINLGLFKRRKVDLELESDLMLSIQFVNKKALINTFANKYDLEKDPNDDYSHLISKYSKDSDDIQYQLDIYKADYIYRTAMYKDPDIKEALENEAERLSSQNKDQEGRELDVYLQYKQAITNYSKVDNVIISGLNMYYDKTLTPVLDDIKKEIDRDEIVGVKATGKAAVSGSNVIIGSPEYRIVTLGTMFSRNFEDVEKETEYANTSVHGSFDWTKESAGDVGKLTTLDNRYTSMDILLPAARRLEVVTNFKVNKGIIFEENGEKIENSLILGNKHHLTEIAGYASYNRYTGKVTGKVDKDSAPANVNLNLLKFTQAGFDGKRKQDFSYLEDDTAVAPMISIQLEKEAPREVSGIIWEEKRNTQVARVNMGDGIYNKAQGEEPIPDKIVALEERVSIKAVDLSTSYKMSQGFDNTILKDDTHYVDLPYVWKNKIDGSGIKINNLKDLVGFQSYVRTGTDGKYKFKGVPAGNFVVQLPYIITGNDVTESLNILDKDTIEITKIVDLENRDKSPQVYNGQDFKVSIYDAGNISTLNETWLPSSPKENYSYGRDSEYDRYNLYQNSKVVNAKIGGGLEILNIGHNKFDTETRQIIEATANMKAETPLINFGISYYGTVSNENVLYNKFADVFALPGITRSSDGKKDVNVKHLSNTYKNVNIALEERPKTKLVLDKEITKLTLKSSDGTKLVDAKYHTTYDVENIIMPAEDKKVLSAENSDKKYDIKRQTQNGYNIDEYILKVKTEIDPDSINGNKVNPLNTVIYSTKKPYWENEKSDSNIYTNARGWENISLNETVTRMSNGYIHLNFDKQLLSDMNIDIEYQVQLYNLGEVDRATIQDGFKTQSMADAAQDNKVSKYVGKLAQSGEKYSKLNHEIDSAKYGFGRFFGTGYYTGNYTSISSLGDYKLYKEAVSKTYANKIIDYIDNSAIKNDLQNDEWIQIKNPSELNSLIAVYDNSGNKTYSLNSNTILDPDGRSYFATGGSNIYMNEKMSEGLIPYYEYVTAVSRGVDKTRIPSYELSSTIAIKRLSSQQADEDLSFDNIVEIVEYATDAGRRTPSSTPGNINTRLSETFDAQNLEPDTGLALLVTITPPTGLSNAQRTLISTLNILIPVMFGIAGVAVLVKVLINIKKKNKILPNEIGSNN